MLTADAAWARKVPTLDHVASRRACFVEGFQLDPAGLMLDADLVASLDPVCHLALHAGRHAWQKAKTENLDLKRVGVVFGNIVLPTDGSSRIAREILGRTFEELL